MSIKLLINKVKSSSILAKAMALLPYLIMVFVFFMLHYNVLFRGYYRAHGDHTIIHFSNLYFLDGFFRDGEFPLWQPYLHFGSLNLNVLFWFDPLLVILGKMFLSIANIFGANSHSMYKITFLSYMSGYMLTFILPFGLLAKEFFKNTQTKWIAFAAVLFSSHIFTMVYIGLDTLFYFPFAILFLIRILNDTKDDHLINNLSGLILSMSLIFSNGNPCFFNHLFTVHVAVAIALLLSSQLRKPGLTYFKQMRNRIVASSKKEKFSILFAIIVAAGLAIGRYAILLRINEFSSFNRVIQTKASFLNSLSANYLYSHHIFPIFENLINMFSFKSEVLIGSGIPYPILYFGLIAIFIFIYMFPQVERKRLFYFFLLSSIFILIGSTNPKDGFNFILPFSYLLNPVYSMGTRHNNIIIMFAVPFVIMAICMGIDRFITGYSYARFPHYKKIFLFLSIASFVACFAYSGLSGYYPKMYIYWYLGIISIVIMILFYFPRKLIAKPYITIPIFLAVVIIAETMIPLRGYIRMFYAPFPKNGGGYFGDNLPIKDAIRGWPVPMCHTFAWQFNPVNLNTTNNIYFRRDNAYFKFFSNDPAYDDTTLYEKDKNITTMPWLSKFSERLFFINKLVPVKEHVAALYLTKPICESGKANQYAVVEGLSGSFESKDIETISLEQLDQSLHAINMPEPAKEMRNSRTILSQDFHRIGTDSVDKRIKLYYFDLPADFPKYLTTNFLNNDYKDIVVTDHANREYKPTYFDLFQEPLRFQIGFNDYRRLVISTANDIPRSITISWRDRFKEEGVDIIKFTYNSLILTTNTTHDSFLVYLDKISPRWKFYLDGKQKNIYTTDGIFKGVFIPKGRHALIFKYNDPLITISYIIYVLFVFVAWVLLVILIRPIRSAKEDYE